MLVTGSRTWDREDIVWGALDAAMRNMPVLASDLCLVHGACPPHNELVSRTRNPLGGFDEVWREVKGADHIAHEWYEQAAKDMRSVDEDPYPADWKMYGNSAGPRRNRQMVKSEPRLCLWFNRNNSRGARNCASLARRAGIPVLEFKYPEGA